MMVVLASTCFAQRSDWRKTKRIDTFEAYQTFLNAFPNSKYHSIAQDSLFQRAKQKNQLHSYESFILNNPSSKFYDIVLDSVFNIIRRENSILAFEGFIKRHPSSKYHNNVVGKIFQIVCEENSVKAYEKFIAKYPKTEFASSAIEGIFKIVSFSKSIDDLEYFVSTYPDYPDIYLAKQFLEEAYYHRALESNSIVMYEFFLNKYPNSNYYAEIRKALISSNYQIIKNSNNLSLIIRFMTDFPDANLYGIQTSQLDSIFWASCVSSDISIEFSNYQNYLNSFPDGVFRNRATQRINRIIEDEWMKAKKVNSSLAYKNFINSFPSSKYQNEANELIKKMEIDQTIKKAIKDGNINKVKELINSGYSLTKRNSQGRTILFIAVESSYYHIPEFLLQRGADPNIKDNAGITPMAIALEKGYSYTALKLRQAKAKFSNNSEILKYIEGQLRLRGYVVGRSEDNKLSHATKEAIKTYQNHVGLSPDGLTSISLADHITKSNNISLYLNKDTKTRSNIFVGSWDLHNEYGWNNRGRAGRSWRPTFLTNSATGGWSENQLFHMTGHFAFGNFQINGGFWQRSYGLVIEHGSLIKIVK